jgi:hypothetical protein
MRNPFATAHPNIDPVSIATAFQRDKNNPQSAKSNEIPEGNGSKKSFPQNRPPHHRRVQNEASQTIVLE